MKTIHNRYILLCSSTSYVNNSVTVRVCVCHKFARYTDIVCSYVESNSVRLVADDDTCRYVSSEDRRLLTTPENTCTNHPICCIVGSALGLE